MSRPDLSTKTAQRDVHLRFELPRKEQISADFIQSVKSVHRLLDAGVQVHNPPGDSVVCHLPDTQTQRIRLGENKV